jgi:hypothetical protein
MTQHNFEPLTTPPELSRAVTLIRGISWGTSLLVALLAIGAFLLSYDALAELAVSSGAVAPHRAWLFPLVVDGGIVIFSVSALRATLCGESSRWYMSLVVTATVASIVCNIAHANGGVVASTVAALPALLLFLALETLMRQVGCSLRPAAYKAKAKVKHRKPTLAVPGRAEATTGRTTGVEVQRERARALLGQGMAKKAVAREVGLALSTVRRLAAGLTPVAPSSADYA